jgi:pilus assembly protein CpaE
MDHGLPDEGCSMAILIASDCPTKATRLRHHLTKNGHDCPFSNVVAVDLARQAATSFQPPPDLIVFVLSQEDDRALAALRHLREVVETPILAVGPRDPNLILDTLHAGANDYLDESSELNGDLTSALNRILESASKSLTSGRLITILAANGGCGRTFFAANLAVQLALTQGRCGLFDLDVAGADAAICLNLKPRHSIADLSHNIDKVDQKMFEQSLAEHASGVFLLAAPEEWEEARFISAEGLQKILRFGKALFPSIVVDLNSPWLSGNVPVLQQSTTVLLLLRLDFPGIRNAHRALSAIDRAGVDPGKVQLVAARYGRPKEISSSQAESVLGVKIRHYLPEDANTVNSCMNCGVSVMLESPGSPIGKAIAGIGKAFCDQHSGVNGAVSSQTNGRKLPVADRLKSLFGLSPTLAHPT